MRVASVHTGAGLDAVIAGCGFPLAAASAAAAAAGHRGAARRGFGTSRHRHRPAGGTSPRDPGRPGRRPRTAGGRIRADHHWFDPTPELVTGLLAEHLVHAVGVHRSPAGRGGATGRRRGSSRSGRPTAGRRRGLVLRRERAGRHAHVHRAAHRVRRLAGPRRLRPAAAPGPLDRRERRAPSRPARILLWTGFPGQPPRPRDGAERRASPASSADSWPGCTGSGRRCGCPPGLAGSDSSAKATLDEISAWAERYAATATRAPAVSALLGWLEANVPADDTEPVLLWGDPGPHNALLGGWRHGERHPRLGRHTWATRWRIWAGRCGPASASTTRPTWLRATRTSPGSPSTGTPWPTSRSWPVSAGR